MSDRELRELFRLNPDIAALNPHALGIQPKCVRVPPGEKMTALEKQFLHYWRLAGGDISDWLYAQHVFPTRPRMHVDFKYHSLPVAVEIDGGQWMKRSGHNNGRGVRRDAEKLALCNELGLTLFRLTTDMVNYEEVQKIFSFVKG